jgi:threonine dehydrogenase-like Zn-dependent dehydrogenase
MSVHLAAKAAGITEIFVSEKIPERIQIAEKTGATLAWNPLQQDLIKSMNKALPEGLDVIFECCGQQDALRAAFELLKPGGMIMIIGIPEFDTWEIPVDLGRRKEITIIHIRRQNESLQQTLDGISSGLYDVSQMPTHHFPLAETQTAFDLVSDYRDGVMKAIITFG